MFIKRPLTLAMAALALAGSTVAASVPAEAAGYTTGGAIGFLYNSQGRTLGAPTSNEYSGRADRVQNFRYGLIYWSSATGAHSVRGGILGEYRSNGSDAGKLGLPITEEKPTVGGGVYQQFKGGIIYWTASRGAHATLGAIRSVYAQTGAERGPLGFPTSSEISARNAGASFVYQNFEHGIISWNGVGVPVFNEDPGHAHVVFGDFYKEYLAAGGAKVVGYISNNEGTSQPDATGAFSVAGQWFQNGGIFYKAGAGVHYLPNAWLDGVSDTDLEALGYPTSGVHAVAGGTAVTFENGSVALGPDGKFTVTLSTPSPTPTSSPSATPTPTVQTGALKGSLVPSPASITRR
ncbi:LGFP repeat-containing protein [Arthrobacter oryzae]|uniref:LGFP repeat-containing protein n=1 Tax=Arthrobacter oryzae TaxID=409290 RepID=A0A495EU20_9MICC|nr:hypothetical protein [Arthrobacter oryzae]RKR20495.1 LGFP repeat-containing protein [Arthrobacter oryzae]